MKLSAYSSRSEFLESFYGIAIAVRVPSVDTSPVYKANKPRNSRYSDFNEHSLSAFLCRLCVCYAFQAALAASCRLCLIACNSRHGDEVGGQA